MYESDQNADKGERDKKVENFADIISGSALKRPFQGAPKRLKIDAQSKSWLALSKSDEMCEFLCNLEIELIVY